MENKNPQDKNFTISKHLTYIQDFAGIITLLLSMIQSCKPFLSSKCFLIITGLILITEFVIEHFQGVNFDEGHYIREATLLDNSFNEKRIPNYNGDLYFNNDFIMAGEIKLLANIHESALFTSKVTEKMVIKYYLILIIAVVFFIIKLFLSGMDDYTSILLSFIISCSFFKRAFKINSLEKISKEIYGAANKICNNYEESLVNKNALQSRIMELVLKYENSLFESKVVLDSKIFETINKQTSDEWESIKKTYTIYKNN